MTQMISEIVARTPESIAPLIDDIVSSCCNTFGIFLVSDAVEMIMKLNGEPDYYNNDGKISIMFAQKDAEDYLKKTYDSYENFNDSICEFKRIEKVRF